MTSLTNGRVVVVAGGGRDTIPARWALASLCLSTLMPSLDTSIANVGLPALARAFAVSFQEVQWIVLAYLLAITSLIVSAGRLGDVVGRKRLLLVGIGLFTIASLLCGAAPVFWVLLVARAAQGIGAAIMLALTMALVGVTVPSARTGRAMGLLGTMSAVGTTLGPSLGGVLLSGPGWRAIFLINVPLGILNFVLALRTLPADHPVSRADRAGFDTLGTLLLAMTLTAYSLAMTIGRGSFGALNLALLAAAAMGIVLFGLVQASTTSPLLPLAILRSPGLRVRLVLSVLVSTVLMATLVVGPFYLSRALGLDAARVGLVISIGPLVAALAGLASGRVVDRFDAGRTDGAALLGLCLGLLALSRAPERFGLAGYVAAIVVVTVNYALFQAVNNTAVMTGVRASDRGLVSGLLGLSRNLGLITGASVMGAVFAFTSSAADVTVSRPAAVAMGMQATFTVAAMLILAGLAIRLAMLLRNSRRPRATAGGEASAMRNEQVAP